MVLASLPGRPRDPYSGPLSMIWRVAVPRPVFSSVRPLGDRCLARGVCPGARRLHGVFRIKPVMQGHPFVLARGAGIDVCGGTRHTGGRSQGGVKVPTGGNRREVRERPSMAKVSSRSGVTPEPTVTVRMKENERLGRLQGSFLCQCGGAREHVPALRPTTPWF